MFPHGDVLALNKEAQTTSEGIEESEEFVEPQILGAPPQMCQGAGCAQVGANSGIIDLPWLSIQSFLKLGNS